MTDILVVGAGLSGLFAACLAAARGASVTLVAQGRGGLSLATGTIQAFQGSLDEVGASPLSQDHPYALAGAPSLPQALAFLGSICADMGLAYTAASDHLLFTVTPAGGLRTCHMAPNSMVIDPTSLGDGAVLLGISSFRDFDPGLAARAIHAGGGPQIPCRWIAPFGLSTARDAYATDLARGLDKPESREAVIASLEPIASGARTVLLPAILGLSTHAALHTDLESRLGIRLVEVPTLPPSVPGLRLEHALRAFALRHGVDLIEGAAASGSLPTSGVEQSVDGVMIRTAAGWRKRSAGHVILATGGFLHGGLHAESSGLVSETVFGIPVAHKGDRSTWLAGEPGSAHPMDRFGVRVNSAMQPLGSDGLAICANLRAIGGLLAEADRRVERSRQGIDLATAYRAVESILS